VPGALREYEEAIRLRPEYPNAHYNLAVTLDEADQYDRARQEYERYLQLAPTAPDAEDVRKRVKELSAAKK
jgi:tetratricopeptide (TPR) repeat protein